MPYLQSFPILNQMNLKLVKPKDCFINCKLTFIIFKGLKTLTELLPDIVHFVTQRSREASLSLPLQKIQQTKILTV